MINENSILLEDYKKKFDRMTYIDAAITFFTITMIFIAYNYGGIILTSLAIIVGGINILSMILLHKSLSLLINKEQEILNKQITCTQSYKNIASYKHSITDISMIDIADIVVSKTVDAGFKVFDI